MPEARSHRYKLALLLLAVAALPRLWTLGELGFYGDEETTAFPARALAEGGWPRMPTGMIYLRGFFITLLNGLSAALLGIDRELAYRLPTAILGTLTVPVLFLMGRRAWGAPTAFVAAWMLALSEWHIAMSREARMYGGFVLLFTVTGLLVLGYTLRPTGARLRWASLSMVVTVGFHTLGRTLASLFTFPAAMIAPRKAGWVSLNVAFTLLTLSTVLSKCVILAPYRGWTLEMEEAGRDQVLCTPRDLAVIVGPLLVLLGGLEALRRKFGADELIGWVRRASTWGAGLALAAALLGGQLYLALLLFIAWTALDPGAAWAIVRKRWWLLPLFGAVAAAHVGYGVMQQGVVQGLKGAISPDWPFAYLVYFHELAGPLGAMLLAVVLWFALDKRAADGPTRFALLTAFMAIFVAGAGSNWNGRYLAGALPFVCLIGSRGLVALCGAGGRLPARSAAVVAALLVTLTPLGIGAWPALRAATVTYGDPLSQLIYAHPPTRTTSRSANGSGSDAATAMS